MKYLLMLAAAASLAACHNRGEDEVGAAPEQGDTTAVVADTSMGMPMHRGIGPHSRGLTETIRGLGRNPLSGRVDHQTHQIGPGHAQDAAKLGDRLRRQPRQRVIVDQVASLTDQSAMSWHSRVRS